MFLVTLGLASAIMWLAFQMYLQAQGAEADRADVAAAREHTRKSHEYLKAQLPRGCVNVRKTVAVDYAQGIPSEYSWDEDLDKTQALPESTPHDSGMRAKIR